MQGKTDKILDEGLWANINKKKKSGRPPSPKGSKAYEAAKKAGEKLERSKKSKMNEIASKYINKDLEKLIEQHNGKVVSTVSKSVDVLITKDLNSTSTSMKKAKELNILIIKNDDILK